MRYVIYARKSTEDAEKQVRSIGDQVADCEKLAEELELHVIATITETKSAKVPGNRPKFTQLMRDIASKKVDGVIAWHPDRLARNMVEAGKIIHMLDTGVLKDLRFKTFQFSNDANGKMMLGMLFVFAKHYSDDLKTKVDRGMQNNLKEGKSSGSPKHGYIRDDEGLYRPDERNFELIKQAWQRRAEGATLTEVADFLNVQGYSKYYKRHQDYVRQKVGRTTLGDMFADTFYFGILSQKDQTVDLREIYNFQPMVDEAMFFKIQEMSASATRRSGKKRMIYFPLKHMLFCDVCHDERPMIIARSRGKQSKYYLYCRCSNTDCPRKPRNIRGKTIFEQIEHIIDERFAKIPPEAYKYYLDEVRSLSDGQKTALRGKITAAQTRLRGYKQKQEELSLALGRTKNSRLVDSLNNQLEDALRDAESQAELVKSYKAQLTKSELPPFSPEEFQNLLQNTALKFKRATGVQKDMIIQNLFLKLDMGEQTIVNYLWKEPFATLFAACDDRYGRGCGI